MLTRISRESKYYKLACSIFIASFCYFSGFHLANAALLNASGLLGQSSYAANSTNYPSGSVNALGFNGVTSVALDAVNHRLFVSDTTSEVNERVLVFSLDTNNNIATTAPSYVLGACNFTSPGSPAVTASTVGFANLTYDSVNARLFVSDLSYQRVLAFNVGTSTIHNCESASFVLGQSDFTSWNIGYETQNGLYAPDDVAYDAVNSRIFVADSGNDRVVAYSVPANATSSINGESPLFEVGQQTFTPARAIATTTQSGLNTPFGVAYDPTNARLFVADSANNRVVAYAVPADATSSINGENALFVLGQPNFTSKLATVTQSGFSPDDISYDAVGNRLFVADNNNRIMIFAVPSDATSSINGENAQNNIGQSDWTSSSPGITQNVFTNPEIAEHAYDATNNQAYEYDRGNNRVVQLKMVHVSTSALVQGVVGTLYSQSIIATSTQGSSQTYSVVSGSLPGGLSLDTSSGVISGVPTTATTTSVTVEADDNFSTGQFFDRANYSLVVNGSLSIVTAQDVTSVTQNAAVLNGTVTSTGGEVVISEGFNYGVTTSYGLTASSTGSFDSGSFTQTITGLDCNTTYHFEVVAMNALGVATSTDQNFVTSACPLLVPTSSGGGGGASVSGPTIANRVEIIAPQSAIGIKLPASVVAATTRLTPVQTLSILQLLQSFNVDTSVVSTVKNILSQNTQPSAPSYIFTNTLYAGTSSSEVAHLQDVLVSLGLLPSNLVTGYFGVLTKAAVGTFQIRNGLVASIQSPSYGLVGPRTREKLNSAGVLQY